MLKLIYSLLLTTLVAACGGDSSPTSVNGTWAQVIALPGASFTMQLSSQNGIVSGSATQTNEVVNPPTNKISISGTYQAPNINMIFTYDTGAVLTYAGTLSDSSHMNGNLLFANGTSASTSYIRQ